MVLLVPGDEAWNPLVDRRFRSKAVIALDRADVREGLLDVADLHRHGFKERLSTSLLLEQLDDPHQVFASTVTNIVKRMRAGASSRVYPSVIERRAIEALDHSPDDIVDVGEVTAHFAAIEQWKRLT